jgi:hypothetical protein
MLKSYLDTYRQRTQAVSLPPTTPIFPAEFGEPFSLKLTDPGAGNLFATLTVPSPYIYRVRGFGAKLVTDATAANRNAALRYRDGSGRVFSAGIAAGLQVASTTAIYSGSLGGPVVTPTAAIPATAQEIDIGIPLPDVFLLPGYTVAHFVRDAQGGDTWSLGTLYVERWLVRVYQAGVSPS